MINKISIVGNSGAGKSTLSHKLGELLSIDVFLIDKIYWLSGWRPRDKESYIKLHEEWMKKERWIIDGVGHWDELVDRIENSDQVIFLDQSVKVCKERAATRINEEKKYPNPNITAGCYYGEVHQLQMDLIERFHSDIRPKLLELFATLRPEKIKIIKDISELEISKYDN